MPQINFYTINYPNYSYFNSLLFNKIARKLEVVEHLCVRNLIKLRNYIDLGFESGFDEDG